MTTIVGQGLVGTLAALEAERLGRDFQVVDHGSGAPATRAAAGLFNPLTGPRFTPESEGWDDLVPFYRDLEQRLGVRLVHEVALVRPLEGAKVGPEAFPRRAPGWTAELVQGDKAHQVRIEGGGWIDLEALLNTTRARWLGAGRLEEREFGAEGRAQNVLWCGGVEGLLSPLWTDLAGVRGRWQGVRGDVLTVRIPGFALEHVELGARFLLPLGSGLFRWGATHESDVIDWGFRPAARASLENDLRDRLEGEAFEVVDHRWGVRPASRSRNPLVVRHPDEPGWVLLNGFGGRGVVQAPRVVRQWFSENSLR